MIPFNKPHGLRVINIQPGDVEIELPYTRSNLNHIKGLHACSIATLAEYATGLALITKLDSKKYRIIMQKIEMEYMFQGKSTARGSYKVNDDWLRKNVYLKTNDGIPALILCQVHIFDTKQNQLAVGKIHWQIKPWESVKTNL